MRPAVVSAALWAVRCALRLYPRRFRQRFEAEILQSVGRDVEAARRAGRAAAAVTAAREVAEALSGAIPQHRLERARRTSTGKDTPMFLFDSMLSDLKAAWRAGRSSPSFTVAAVLVLMLGIGATTAIFSVVDAVVLRGLPFDDSDRLVAVGERRLPNPATPAPRTADPLALSSIAPQNYLDWVRQQQVFESMAAVASGTFTLLEPGTPPEALAGLRVTSEFFQVLRARPAHGRPFTKENEANGSHRVAILSHGLWQRRFGGDPALVGKTIPLEDGPYEVAGIMPEGFEYPVSAVPANELWVPYVVPAAETIRNPNVRSFYLQSVARLKPGVTVEQAYAEIDRIAQSLQQVHPAWNQGMYAGVRPLRDHIVGGRTKSWMLMLLGAVAIVLLIACANVANLLLARATVREQEISVRAALGAGRWRLVRQLMTESIALSAAGTACGLLLAWWAMGVLQTAMLPIVPRIADLALDLRVLTAAAGLSLLTAVIFGVAPALQLARTDVARTLGEGRRGATSGRAGGRLRSGLVIAEITLSVILLVGAALFIGSFRMLMKVDPGFDARHVITASVQPRLSDGRGVTPAGGSTSVTGQPAAPPPATDHGALYQQLVARIAELPNVAHAAAISGGTPLSGSQLRRPIEIPSKEGEFEPISVREITADFHRAMGMTIVAGRQFERTDDSAGVPVAILNESAALRYFPREGAVGRTIVLNGAARTVVGVLKDVYQNSLETAPPTEVHIPLSQSRVIVAQLVIKTEGAAEAVIPAVRAIAQDVLPGVPLRSIRTMESVVGGRIAQRRLNMLLIGLFGLLGLVISAVGIYALMAYVVSQRTREIGLRMALGATDRRVLGMVVRHAARLVAAGLLIGGVGAWYLSTMVQSFLFRVDPTDPRAFAAALIVLGVVSLAASAIPAKRAASVDPVVALRAQ